MWDNAWRETEKYESEWAPREAKKMNGLANYDVTDHPLAGGLRRDGR